MDYASINAVSIDHITLAWWRGSSAGGGTSNGAFRCLSFSYLFAARDRGEQTGERLIDAFGITCSAAARRALSGAVASAA